VSKSLHSKQHGTDFGENVIIDRDYRLAVLTILWRELNSNSAPEVLRPHHLLRIPARI